MDKTARLKCKLVAILFVAVVLLVLLPGCAPEDKRLDFEKIWPSEWQVYDIYRLDTNADNQKDWVILYNFDPKEKSAFTPVGGYIYHARGEPPIVYPYELSAPGWGTFLGEGKSSIELQEILLDAGGTKPKVVYKSVNSDGITTRVAIFQWQDHAKSELVAPDDNAETGQWYRCLGKFEGEAGVKLDPTQVTVWEPKNDRSQLAIRKIYYPQAGSYMVGDDLKDPSQQCLDFAYGQPQNVDTSPYPDKVLMAFYRNFTTEEAFSFLTEEAQKSLRNPLPDSQWAQIAPWPRTAVTGICVKSLNYNPSEEEKAKADLILKHEQAIQAQATANTGATTCECPEPACTCPSTATIEIASEPVPVTAEVEYELQGQKERRKLLWRFVKIKNVWRIAEVAVIK
ncbi:MAG: hypothetical protein JXA89_00790 [Anaerolineae bacterium]|nr:hypothetical protein [Anaerolineae bacterium]